MYNEIGKNKSEIIELKKKNLMDYSFCINFTF